MLVKVLVLGLSIGLVIFRGEPCDELILSLLGLLLLLLLSLQQRQLLLLEQNVLALLSLRLLPQFEDQRILEENVAQS